MSSLDLARVRQRIQWIEPRNAFSNTEIERLQEELDQAKVMELNKIPEYIITMNSVVSVKYLTTHNKFTIQLVYPEDANIKVNKVSIFAPIGAALLGYKKSDIICWNAPGGSMRMLVEDVWFQPEAAGEFYL